MPTLAELETERLKTLPPSDTVTYALADLQATPEAAYCVTFVGELFYGATAKEAFEKAAEFAEDGGEDMVAEYATNGATLTQLPFPTRP